MATKTLRDSLDALNKVRYSGQDFESFNDDIRNRLQQKFAEDFNDLTQSSMAIVLMDLVSFSLDTLSFYLDRRATDIYLASARTSKSISRLARQLGYKIKGAVPSSVDLTVSLTTVQVIPVTIPVGFKFKTTSGILFETAQAVTFDIGDSLTNTQIIPCFQGTTLSESFTSNGQPNQTFELTKIEDNKFLSFGSVSVLVNGSPFTEVEFLNYQEDDQVEVNYFGNPPTIKFGDGISGTIPVKNSTITVVYIATDGLNGLVPAGDITLLDIPLNISGTNISLTVINEESSVGGDNVESIASIKSFAGRMFKTRDVAITESDYEALAGSYADPLFGRVAIAKALSTKSASSDIELQNQINIINDSIDAIEPAVTVELATINTALTAIDTSVSLIQSTNNLIDADILSINDNLENLLISERTNKGAAQEMVLQSSNISTNVDALIDAVNDIPVFTSNALTTATKTQILDYLTLIATNNNSLIDNAGTVNSGSSSAITDLNESLNLITNVETNLVTVDTQVANIGTTAGTTNPSTGIRLSVGNISSEITNQTNDVDNALAAINEHVDQFLATDCSANLVTVPILALDNEGLYAAPAIGLVRSLQSFLDARKEVTQTVQVTSGVEFLIPAALTLRIGIFPGFSESLVTATATSVLNGILRGRAFGDSLYISDLLCDIKDLSGVSFANIVIDGFIKNSLTDASKLDEDGNLIIEDNEVITKGSITIAVETVFKS